MLDVACIRRPGLVAGEYDLGRILETMLYYEKVHLYVDMQQFTGLWKAVGFSGMRDLLGHPSVTASITPEFSAVKNEARAGFTTHMPIFGRIMGDQKTKVSSADYAGSLYQSVKNIDSGYAIKRQVEKIISLGKKTSYRDILGIDATDNKLFFSAVEDPRTLKMFVAQWAKNSGALLNSSALDRVIISTYRLGEEIVINSDQPFHKLFADTNSSNEMERKWDAILPSIHDYVIDLLFSSQNSADLICSEEVGRTASERLDISIQRSVKNISMISNFQENLFGNSKSFSESINNGSLSLTDALKTIDRTRKFREWTSDLPPSSDLLEEYILAINKDHLIEKLPVKAARFAIFSGAGLGIDVLTGGSGLGTAAGLGLSALDSFVMDHIFKGWRPSSFVKEVKSALR